MPKTIVDKLAVPNGVINRVLYQEILEEMPLTLKELDTLNCEISNSDKLDCGGEGKVYELGNECVGKILHCPNPNSAKFYSALLLEGISQILAYKRGINVPKVEGIFKIKRKEDEKYWPILVMRKLSGFKFENSFEASQVNDEDYYFYLNSGRQEVEKAKSLGIKHVDFAENMFACPKKNKTYLIDWSDAEFEGVDFSEIKIEEEE